MKTTVSIFQHIALATCFAATLAVMQATGESPNPILWSIALLYGASVWRAHNHRKAATIQLPIQWAALAGIALAIMLSLCGSLSLLSLEKGLVETLLQLTPIAGGALMINLISEHMALRQQPQF